MNNPRLLLATLLSGALCAGPAHADCDFDDFPLMESMDLASVAESMQWNNLPMSIKGFRVSASVEAVKAFYGERWQDEVDFTEFGAWQQILHINDECMMMVQLQAQNGQSTGRLMLVNPPDEDLASRVLGAGVPVPPDAVVVTDMQNQDRYRAGQLVMLLSEDSLEGSMSWYQAEMQRTGWRQNRRQMAQNNATLIYSKGREQLSVVLLRVEGGQTQILINRMDR